MYLPALFLIPLYMNVVKWYPPDSLILMTRAIGDSSDCIISLVIPQKKDGEALGC